MLVLKRLSKQREKVGKRPLIGVRPERKLFRKLEILSKKEGISMNQIALRILNEGTKKGVNTLA